MIDIHCHLNEFNDFIKIAEYCEKYRIKTISMTNRPTEFSKLFLTTKKFKLVRVALGLHPMEVPFSNYELKLFNDLKNQTSYIGEIGLDFSEKFFSKKEEQLSTFNYILNSISKENKILSLHSRHAEKEVLEHLIHYHIEAAVFHWYTGPLYLIDDIIKYGYYFSINPSMTFSIKGKKIIRRIPKNRILIESDSPFSKVYRITPTPLSVKIVYKYLSNIWDIDINTVIEIIDKNFREILIKIK